MAGPTTFAHAAFGGRIGVARRDITPPVGIYARNWGAANHDAATGIHCPLTVTVLVLQTEDGSKTVALATLDLISGGDPDNELVRTVRDALDLDPAEVMLAFSHTHAAPPWHLDGHAHAHLQGMDKVPAFGEKVKQALRDAAREARATLQPGRLECSYGRCALAAHRDQADPEGGRIITGFAPEARAPDTLWVGRACDADGHIVATLVNYACHPTTLAWQNELISPDWIGAMREVIETGTKDAPCLFMQGASGELAPRDQYTADTEVADRNGRQVGYAVLSTLNGMLPPGAATTFRSVVESGAPLGHWAYEASPASKSIATEAFAIKLPIKPDWPGAEQIRDEMDRTEDRALKERLRRKLTLRQRLGEGDAFNSPAWLWKVGDILLLGQINEAYSPLQTKSRAAFPNQSIAVMNVVNGNLGYLPPRALFTQDVYQVWQTPFAAGCLERTIDACRNRMKNLCHS